VAAVGGVVDQPDGALTGFKGFGEHRFSCGLWGFRIEFYFNRNQPKYKGREDIYMKRGGISPCFVGIIGHWNPPVAEARFATFVSNQNSIFKELR
jgi:hypothetical protein